MIKLYYEQSLIVRGTSFFIFHNTCRLPAPIRLQTPVRPGAVRPTRSDLQPGPQGKPRTTLQPVCSQRSSPLRSTGQPPPLRDTRQRCISGMGRFFQATVKFNFDDLANYDVNYNVYNSVSDYYRAIRGRTLTFVNDCYGLFTVKFGPNPCQLKRNTSPCPPPRSDCPRPRPSTLQACGACVRAGRVATHCSGGTRR